MSEKDLEDRSITAENKKQDHPVKNLGDITYALDQAAIVAITDQTGKIIYVNKLFTEISQYHANELLGGDHRIINSGYHPSSYFKEMWATIGRGGTWRGEICNRAKDGSIYWVDTTIVPFLNKKGKPYQYISIRSDVTLQKVMEQEIRQSAEMYKLITENSSDFISVVDGDAKFKYASPSHEKLLGFNLSKLVKSNLSSIVIEEDREVVKSNLKSEGAIGSFKKPIEFRIKNANEDILFMETTINKVKDQGKYSGDIVLVMRDITNRKESEKVIHDLASNDQLTDLLNRVSFREKLSKNMKLAKKSNERLGFVYFNIDRLRYVNDSLGHEAGDYVLSIVAKRLKEILRYDDVVGRIAGDEFALLLQDVDDARHVIKITKEVQSFVEEPIEVAGQSYILSTSCGIAMFPEHAQYASELVMKARQALYNVKAQGGNGYEMYRHGTAEKTLERILLENEMGKSIKLGYFYLDYQPKVNLVSGEWIGLEALVRWNHPDLGRIRPDKFIPVAEETKLILSLGEWVLREACKQVKKWQDNKHGLRVAINISAVQLEDPTFIELVKSILTETGVSPLLIEFELTESAFGDRAGMQEKMVEIRKLGITIAIDDFGTGYSTFSYIKELAVDRLKIDMSFIRDIHKNEESLAICKTILSLAKTFGLNVVAEGIEEKEQSDILLALGCQEGQGYFYSKPINPEACEQHMQKLKSGE